MQPPLPDSYVPPLFTLTLEGQVVLDARYTQPSPFCLNLTPPLFPHTHRAPNNTALSLVLSGGVLVRDLVSVSIPTPGKVADQFPVKFTATPVGGSSDLTVTFEPPPFFKLFNPNSTGFTNVELVGLEAADYFSVTLVVQHSPARVQLVVTKDRLLFYSSSPCGPNTFGPTCRPCPEGAWCPSGGRAFPTPGYWGLTEFEVPVRCPYSLACPGADPLAGDPTSICAPGYLGHRCGQCAGAYYLDTRRCRSCASSGAGDTVLRAAAVCGLVLFLALSVCVVYATPRSLGVATRVVVAVQQVAANANLASSQLPSWASDFLAVLNLTNFDFDLVKPGCAGFPALTYLTVFWSTIAVLGAGAVVMVGVAPQYVLGRAGQKSRRHLAAVLYASLLYYNVTLLCLQNLQCVAGGGAAKVLAADLKTVCWEAPHTVTFVFSCLVLCSLTAGFPVYLLRSLRREARHPATAAGASWFGHYLDPGVRRQYYWWPALDILVGFCLAAIAAAQQVVLGDGSLELLLSGLVFAGVTCAGLVLAPLTTLSKNVQTVVVHGAQVLQAAVLIGVVQVSTEQPTSSANKGFVVAVLLVAATLTVVAFLRFRCLRGSDLVVAVYKAVRKFNLILPATGCTPPHTHTHTTLGRSLQHNGA